MPRDGEGIALEGLSLPISPALSLSLLLCLSLVTLHSSRLLCSIVVESVSIAAPLTHSRGFISMLVKRRESVCMTEATVALFRFVHNVFCCTFGLNFKKECMLDEAGCVYFCVRVFGGKLYNSILSSVMASV